MRRFDEFDYIDKIKAFTILLIFSIGGSFLIYDTINSTQNDTSVNYTEISGIVSDYALSYGRNKNSTMISIDNNSLKILIVNYYRDALDFNLFRQNILKGNPISIKILKPENMGFMDKFNYRNNIVHAKSVRFNGIEIINKPIKKESLVIDYIFLTLFIINILISTYKLTRLIFFT